MTAKKKISRTAAERKDGKKGPGDQLQHNKSTANNKKCEYQKKSKANSHLYCKKSPGGAYCVEDPGSKGSAFQCPLKIKKYTLVRTNEDIELIEKVRRQLNSGLYFHHSKFNTDSEIYKKLPELYLNAVKKQQDLQLTIDELTAKMATLEDLRTSFCRILELCDKTDESSEPPEALQKNVAKCANFDSGDDDCEGCDGFNTDCDDYEARDEK